MNKTVMHATSVTGFQDSLEVPSWAKAERWARALIARRIVKEVKITSKNRERTIRCRTSKT
jgi:hypothetical protein